MKQYGPVPARCDTVTLIENSSGRWQEKCSVPLGGVSDLSVFPNG